MRVAAAPVEGAANRALIRLLAEELGVPPAALRVVLGEHGRRKGVVADGVPAEVVTARWPGLSVWLPGSPASGSLRVRGAP